MHSFATDGFVTLKVNGLTHRMSTSASGTWRSRLGAAALCTLLALPAGIDSDDEAAGLMFLPSQHGTLVICGGGETPDDVLLQFVDAAGGQDARIVVVTTASGTADSDEIEDDLEFW